MTSNDQVRKYHETCDIIRQVRETIRLLEHAENEPGGASPVIRRAELAGYRGILKNLEEQTSAYEARQSTRQPAA